MLAIPALRTMRAQVPPQLGTAADSVLKRYPIMLPSGAWRRPPGAASRGDDALGSDSGARRGRRRVHEHRTTIRHGRPHAGVGRGHGRRDDRLSGRIRHDVAQLPPGRSTSAISPNTPSMASRSAGSIISPSSRMTSTGQLSEYSDEWPGICITSPRPLTVGMSATLAPPQPAGDHYRLDGPFVRRHAPRMSIAGACSTAPRGPS